MVVRKPERKRGWAMMLAVAILKPLLLLTTRRDWRNGDGIPASGGFVLALNHVSHVDPVIAAHIVYDHGRLPRYLAKAALFKNRALGYFLRSAGQIPVERLSRSATGAYEAAVEAIRDGECVVVYVEGSITKDPDGWPMKGKSGAARIALATGCPVIPVGQWGAQQLLAPYAKRPSLFPPKLIKMSVGEPVDLGDLLEREPTAEVVREATDRIMAAITTQVEEVRGATAPPERFDPKAHGLREIGNPNRAERRRGLFRHRHDHHHRKDAS